VAAAAGRPERDIGILPIPIDSERFSPAPDQDWRGLLEGPILVFVGRADDPRKNLPLLLRAFAEARETLPNARLRLVGAAPSAPTPAGVEVVGRVDDVASELRKSALFVLPSSQEGFCIAAAEALAAGLPVVSTPCGGPEEMIRSSGGGVVVESFEASDLAAAITGVVSDVGGAAAMRAAGRDHVRRLHAPDRFRELLADALRKADD
jgi:glycosyltransferase involved in cell wall biosynthesis